MTDHMKELCEKFRCRNLMEELAWYASYPPRGYVRKGDTDLIQWVMYMAYQKIKEASDGTAQT